MIGAKDKDKGKGKGKSEDSIVIGLCGLPRAGKDTVADYLVKEYGFIKISFAEGVYKVAQDIFDMKEKDRDLLIAVGQKMREIDPRVWIKQAEKRIEEERARGNNRFVISDMRFLNEYDWIMGMPLGFVTRVYAPLKERKKRPGFNEQDDYKASEGLLENLSMFSTILNDSDIPAAEAEVDKEMVRVNRIANIINYEWVMKHESIEQLSNKQSSNKE